MSNYQWLHAVYLTSVTCVNNFILTKPLPSVKSWNNKGIIRSKKNQIPAGLVCNYDIKTFKLPIDCGDKLIMISIKPVSF